MNVKIISNKIRVLVATYTMIYDTTSVFMDFFPSFFDNDSNPPPSFIDPKKLHDF